jgi:hypothetical protein
LYAYAFPSAVPQSPFIGVGFLTALQVTLVPELIPLQVHETEDPDAGNAGEDGTEVPLVQNVPEYAPAL